MGAVAYRLAAFLQQRRFDYHLPLKKETKRKLAKISALSNISEAKMLDKIIQEAYVRLEADKY